MYNERKDNFSIKDVVLQILFVVLFIFILMWLFPSKSFLKDSLEPLYDRIFNENILNMKEAAKGYYTTPRLPQKVGDKVSMTLGDMLDKKLLIPFKDSKGRSCDNTASYVQVTKMDEEYIMKVNLKCSEQENYILVYMGCYDYCKTTICEKDEKDVKSPTIIPSKNDPTNPSRPTPKPVDPDNPKPTPDPDNPNPTPDNPKEYICKYVKTVDASYTPWGKWSGWSTSAKHKDDLTQVESKTETTFKDKTVQIGERVKTTTYKDPNKPIYGTKQVQVGTKQESVCTATTTVKVGTGQYKWSDWYDTGLVKDFGSEPPYSESEVWVFLHSTSVECGSCTFGRYRTYKQQKRNKYEITENKQVCSNWQNKTVPVYKTITVIVDYGTSQRIEKEPIYGTVREPVYTKYYRYRTRSLKDGWRDEKWSECNDKDLTNKGYKWTGEKKEK